MNKIILKLLILSIFATNAFADNGYDLKLVTSLSEMKVEEFPSALLDNVAVENIDNVEIGSIESVDKNTNIFGNTKEDQTRYLKKINIIHERYLYNRFTKQGILKFLENSRSNAVKSLCASSWVSEIRNSKFSREERHVKTLILIMRQNNLIDDITTDILLKARKIRSHFFIAPSIVEQKLTFNRSKIKKYYKKNASKIFSNCQEDKWRSFYSGLRRDKLFKKKEISIRNLNYFAKKYGFINKKTFKELEKFRSSDVTEWPLTLREYSSKKNVINNSLENQITPSEFVTKVKKGSKRSLRQRLYERYSTLQIKVLASILIKMKKRFSAISSTITINYGSEEEVISLNTMERFRMNLKLMRKELNDLNNTSEFSKIRANYFDIIAAAFEMNLVKSEEIDYLVKFKEIWSPTKTKMQKIMYWVRSVGSVGAILVPQPFDFLVIMGLMVIDGNSRKDKRKFDKDYTIF